jgi:hypothetical protein
METLSMAGIPITGSTTINHEVRHKLNLTNDQFILLDFLQKAFEEKREITYELIYRKTAITQIEYDTIIPILYQRNLVRDENVKTKRYIRVSKVFKQAFYVNEKDFDLFWKDNKGVCCWPGSRTDALQKYILARREYPHDYLMKQRNWYFRMLELPEYSFRQKMGAPVFLNMKTKRFEEDFEAAVRAITGVERKDTFTQSLDKAKKDLLFV